tara:strand:- start:36 stop:1544 length:1509 start_codon:yes stop_codon:yes gene_type:complete
MAENTFQNSSEFKLKKCTISYGDGSNTTSLLSGDMIAAFSFHESIVKPFVAGSLMLSDSTGFLTNFPIQGGEIVEIEVSTSFDEQTNKGQATKYKLKVMRVASRTIKEKMQIYTLVMVSEEAFVNEIVRLEDPLSGKPDEMVTKLVREKLKSSKEIFVEPCKFSVKMLPAKRRPFDIIADLTKRSISGNATYTNKKTKTGKISNKRGREVGSTYGLEKEIKGTAGYFFWESLRGFNFYSVDALCSLPKLDKEGNYKEGTEEFPAKDLRSKPWGPYEEVIANLDNGKDQRGIVSNFKFKTEVDVIASLRKGKYASVMVFFNMSTGQYEEYTYKIKQSYDAMSHLGGQDSISLIPTSQEELSETPSRIMSAVLDHEAWYNDPDIADPDSAATDNPSEYADWIKYYAAQTVARYDLLANQEADLTIPGNPSISAGDKVSVLVLNKVADKLKVKKPYDEETSGVYLVKEVSHKYDRLQGGNGNMTTVLKLFRDSYGMTDLKSNRGE